MVFNSHIGVLAFPFGTHAPPLLALVRRLAAAKPDALVSFFNSAISNSTLFNGRVSDSCENIRVYDVWDGKPEGFTGSHFEAVDLFVGATPGNFDEAIGVAEEENGLKICCLITDAFRLFACDMTEKRGVLWVPFWTGASCSLSAHVYTHEIVNAVGSTEKTEQEQTLSFIPGLPSIHLSDLPPEICLDEIPTPTAITINKMAKTSPNPLDSFEEIDSLITNDLKSKFRHFLNVGPSILIHPTPLAPEDKTGCLSWLENQNKPKSVVYISFGTVITPPGNELIAVAEALETCQLPFLWALKAQESLPEGFLERMRAFGKIVPWAPQLQVIGHANVGVSSRTVGGIPYWRVFAAACR